MADRTKGPPAPGTKPKPDPTRVRGPGAGAAARARVREDALAAAAAPPPAALPTSAPAASAPANAGIDAASGRSAARRRRPQPATGGRRGDGRRPTDRAQAARKTVGDLPEPQDERDSRERARAELLAEGRLGDPTVTARELAHMGTHVAARHVMVRLAMDRADRPRTELIAETGALLIALERPDLVRRLLLELPDAGRIVDVYPLEVLAYVLEHRPDLLPEFSFGRIVLNRQALEASTFAVGETIELEVPLALKMRAFALEGGGSPGYDFAPGAPGTYELEFGAPGTWRILIRGDVRGFGVVERLTLRVGGSG